MPIRSKTKDYRRTKKNEEPLEDDYTKPVWDKMLPEWKRLNLKFRPIAKYTNEELDDESEEEE